jgi:hypothetical protein
MQLLTETQVAQMLAISLQTVRRMRAGEKPKRRSGSDAGEIRPFLDRDDGPEIWTSAPGPSNWMADRLRMDASPPSLGEPRRSTAPRLARGPGAGLPPSRGKPDGNGNPWGIMRRVRPHKFYSITEFSITRTPKPVDFDSERKLSGLPERMLTARDLRDLQAQEDLHDAP